jgi:signal transduction histidine kinase
MFSPANSAKKDAQWIKSVEDLEEAYGTMLVFAAEKPGPYFIFSKSERTCIATIDTDGDPDDNQASVNARHKRTCHAVPSGGIFRSAVPHKRHMGNTVKTAQGSKNARAEISTVAPDRSLSAAILEAQDNERRRISRELHDGVGQSLVAIKMEIEKFKARLRSDDATALDGIGRTVDEATAEVRTVAHLLYPLSLEALGLRSSIMEYAKGFQERTGIQTTVEIPESLPKFERVAETAVFRIIQKCLTNVHKHAKATNVSILAVVTGDELLPEITDDGIGFPVTSVNASVCAACVNV